VDVAGGYAYLAGLDDGLRIIDVGNPAGPVEVGHYDAVDYSWDVAVDGDYAYLADSWGGLRIIDVSVPASPAEIATYSVSDAVWGVAPAGDCVFVAASYGGFRVLNVHDPANPVETGFYETAYRSESVAVAGDIAYVADGQDGLYILDCSDSVPVLLQMMSLARVAGGVKIVWEVADEADVLEYRLYRNGAGETTEQVIAALPAGGLSRYEYVDTDAPLERVCRYTVTAVERNGVQRHLGSRELAARASAPLSLSQNIPNPFNPRTSIVFVVPKPVRARLEVFDTR
jgi:hypothetical protein